MEKLELKHIVGYLPYEIKIFYMEDAYDVTLEDEMDSFSICLRDVIEGSHKPILRPLSDLKKEITHKGETFVPIKKIKIMYPSDTFSSVSNVAKWSYRVIEKLYEWHFDIHGLIEKGLAIEINTIDNGIQ